MKVILINGPYGGGKDTLGNFLAQQPWPSGSQRVLHINFADWVKDAAKRYYAWDGNKTTAAGRHFLQYFATDTVRHADADYWGDVVARLCAAIQADFDIFIITDFRFPNEYDCIAKCFSVSDIITIHIDRNMPENECRAHESENSLQNFVFDYYIDNNGPLEQLQESAAKLFEEIN